MSAEPMTDGEKVGTLMAHTPLHTPLVSALFKRHDTALSRPEHGFKSRWGYHQKSDSYVVVCLPGRPELGQVRPKTSHPTAHPWGRPVSGGLVTRKGANPRSAWRRQGDVRVVRMVFPTWNLSNHRSERGRAGLEEACCQKLETAR